MERRVFDTIINKKWTSPYGDNNVVDCNAYIFGRVCGVSLAICDSEYGITMQHSHKYSEDPNNPIYGWLTVFTTEEQYKKFEEIVTKNYGDLCVFDAKLGHNKIYRDKN